MTNTTIDESGRRTASVAVWRARPRPARQELQKRATWKKHPHVTNISIKSPERSYQYI